MGIKKSIFENKNILITGSCGSIGKILIQKLLNNKFFKPNKIICLDNNEEGIFFLEQKYLKEKKIECFVSDIRDRDEMNERFQSVHIAFHTAALKHVASSERSPSQVIRTNILGVENVIFAATKNQLEKVIFTSSDKAVNPTNVMGTSKLMGERLITAANYSKNNKTVFSSTRFGNVLGSSGSVIPLFHNQIKNGGPITITSIEMSRFIMSIDEAVELIIGSAEKAKGGEVLIAKMPSIKILDLANAMINLLAPKYGYKKSDIKINIIGIKSGEKIYEELTTTEEIARTYELSKYYSVLPALLGIYNNVAYDYDDITSKFIKECCNSENSAHLSIEEIEKLLITKNVLEMPASNYLKRYWPGDKDLK